MDLVVWSPGASNRNKGIRLRDAFNEQWDNESRRRDDARDKGYEWKQTRT